jgi:hypothetical protein
VHACYVHHVQAQNVARGLMHCYVHIDVKLYNDNCECNDTLLV